jgi:hypothetical protein
MPSVIDRGTHIELMIGPALLCGPGFIDIVLDAVDRFAAKPLLVICDGPAESVGYIAAYENGLNLSSLVRARVAIALGGREPTDTDRLTELVAANRGGKVRSFQDRTAAKNWLVVD